MIVKFVQTPGLFLCPSDEVETASSWVKKIEPREQLLLNFKLKLSRHNLFTNEANKNILRCMAIDTSGSFIQFCSLITRKNGFILGINIYDLFGHVRSSQISNQFMPNFFEKLAD